MDVIRLFERDNGDELNGSSENPLLAVSDDLDRLVSENNTHFTIYVVFTEELRLMEPFRIFHLNDGEELRRVPAEDVLKSAIFMWANDEIRMDRSAGSRIQLNFYRLNNKIHFSCMDITKTRVFNERVLIPTVHVLENTLSGTHLILRLNKKSVLVLSENSYTNYLAGGKWTRYPIMCTVGTEENDVPFEHFDCGHVLCCVCSFRCKMKFKDGKCAICMTDSIGSTRYVKFRDGPCPFDLCNTCDITKGVVLVPCGCHIPCEVLASQIRQDCDQKDTLSTFHTCPYDACCEKIERILRIFN